MGSSTVAQEPSHDMWPLSATAVALNTAYMTAQTVTLHAMGFTHGSQQSTCADRSGPGASKTLMKTMPSTYQSQSQNT